MHCYSSQVVNHLIALNPILTKTGLVRSLSAYYKSHGPAVETRYSLFDSVPYSYILQPQLDDDEYYKFVQRFREIANGGGYKEPLGQKHCAENVWLVKPANMNQGAFDCRTE